MNKPNIQTTKNVVPMIYAYTTPEITRHNGWTKIGYTEQDVETRIKQQTHTADIKWNLEWKKNAIYDDGSGDTFIDKDFHAYMRKCGIEQEEGKNNEWFHINGNESKRMINDFKENRGIIQADDSGVIPYNLRQEQADAVQMTIDYKNANRNGEFLWNAKPRFGKTLSVYDFIKKIDAKNVLIVTNRPAIANSWYSDYEKFLGRESGYFFISSVDGIKNKKYVISYEDYKNTTERNKNLQYKCIEFVSLQDLKGSSFFGGEHYKLKEITDIKWDVLVIDEAHEGVDTYKTDIAFEHINRDFTLHLSGTPFKALSNSKFNSNAIYNWTYADEQKRKAEWDNSSGENPYENLPKLNLYTYQMSEIIRDELKQGIEINGETKEYAFDLNDFFSTNNGKFVYESSVDKFLDAMTCQAKFPFSTDDLRMELKHTFWLLDRVESAKALAKKLENHPIFKDYKVILAVGNGRLDDEDDEFYESKKSYDKVVKAIKENEKTITLSVGQLTTGITIPEWTAVLMLSNVKSPALYMQAAFRAQNPCLFKNGVEFKRKENAYVFDFDPARTLKIFEQFANNLNPNTSNGYGTADERKKNIKELLNFFPVIGEDENGKLVELDAEKVLTIPRKIYSVEVVKRGFMSNFLFQNVSNIFGAPKEVIDIISNLTPVEEQKNGNLHDQIKKDFPLDDDGNIELNDEIVIGKTVDVFGDKVYDTESLQVADEVISQIEEIRKAEQDNTDILKDKLKTLIKEQIETNIIAPVQQAYGSDMKKSVAKQIEAKLNRESGRIVDKESANFNIRKNIIEQERKSELQNRFETGKSTSDINAKFDKKQEDAAAEFNENLKNAVGEFIKASQQEAVKEVETKKQEREKSTIENSIRDRLRGFSRTIPSFLMAYGNENVTLANFDEIIPDGVFLEVTSITLKQFRFLRDGGDYVEEETGETKHFAGKLFDPVVFDDSVKEFLSLKKKLANYFDENSEEDIFDYIPPQKTNQIFTPKNIVKKMVDMLEEENPGCFDMPDKTFIDLYMKSGLYITEIVKRLYQSRVLKEKFPDKNDRLKHIFENQVYGLAPTEIIYKIAVSYILGFDESVMIKNHNFRHLDALQYAKSGTLEQKLDDVYSD